LLECASGVIKRLPRKFVCGKVVLFTMVFGGNTVRMGSLIVHLSGYLMGVIWHNNFLRKPAYTLCVFAGQVDSYAWNLRICVTDC
jgi:hypothetical protein